MTCRQQKISLCMNLREAIDSRYVRYLTPCLYCSTLKCGCSEPPESISIIRNSISALNGPRSSSVRHPRLAPVFQQRVYVQYFSDSGKGDPPPSGRCSAGLSSGQMISFTRCRFRPCLTGFRFCDLLLLYCVPFGPRTKRTAVHVRGPD